MSKKSVKAAHGENMVAFTVRFWTDEIAATPGEIIPKHGWDFGTVVLRRNGSHGIEPIKKHFRSMASLPSVMEDMLIEAGVVLRLGRRTQQFMDAPEKEEN